MALPSVSETDPLREERTYIAPPENAHTARLANGTPVIVRQSDVILPLGPRVRWGGIIGGCVVAVGFLMLLTALGLAVGLSAADDLWQMNTETIKDFATGAGLWTTISLLAAFFIAGLVAAKITDRPDGGAFLHGMLTWVILSSFLSWLVSSGMRPELAGVSGRPNSATSSGSLGTVPLTLTGDELARSLGLDDPGQVSTRLTDPRIPLIVAAAAGLSAQDAQAVVNELQTRVAAVRDDPAAVSAEVNNFMSRLLERAHANAPQTTDAVRRNAEVSSWTLFGIMALTLLISTAGAFVGVPNRNRWQSALGRV
jgi:hypothetical protein